MLIAGTIIGLTLVLIGIIGSVMPVIPGPQLAYLGILLFHFMSKKPFSTQFLIIRLIVMILLIVMDYILPALSTKKFGGTKTGMRGAGIGTFVGIFGGIWTILLAPFFGAWIGEWRSKRDRKKTIKPALGSFIGIALSGIIKIGICIILGRKLLITAIALG